MKIRQVGAELSHADRQTDMRKLIVAFCNFANAPKNQSVDVVWENNGYVKLAVYIVTTVRYI
jgi:hypothetical protein